MVLAEERCDVRNPSLHQRTVATSLLPLVCAAAIATSACDNNNGVGRVSTAPTAAAFVIVSPSLINLTALGGFNCPGQGFSPSFNLIVTASGSSQSMSAATFTLIDGTTLGGPSITIPSPQLRSQFGSTVIVGGTSRTFAMNPIFSCPGIPVVTPHSMRATVVLTDTQGREEAFSTTVNFR
jgi:hypothetical protein